MRRRCVSANRGGPRMRATWCAFSGVAGATTPVNGRSDGGAGASRKCRGERSPGTASADCAQCLSVIEAGAPPIMSQGSPDGITATLPCVLSARNVAQPIAATAAWANASDARAASAMRRKWRAVNMNLFYASRRLADAGTGKLVIAPGQETVGVQGTQSAGCQEWLVPTVTMVRYGEIVNVDTPGVLVNQILRYGTSVRDDVTGRTTPTPSKQ